jgi:hypothetical protein
VTDPTRITTSRIVARPGHACSTTSPTVARDRIPVGPAVRATRRPSPYEEPVNVAVRVLTPDRSTPEREPVDEDGEAEDHAD